MRLLIVSHAYLNDQYLPSLEAMSTVGGVELALLTPNRVLGVPFHWESESSIARFPIPVQFGFRQGTFLYNSRALLEALDRFRPDILLHEQEVYALSAGQIATAASKRRIPVVMFVWENTFRRLSIPRRIHRGYVLSKLAGLIAGSDHAMEVHERWGFKGHKAVIPQMGVELNNCPIFGRRQPGLLSVCFAGRLEPLKGVDCLVRAVATLQRSGTRVVCKIAGTGTGEPALKALVRELGIEDAVIFTGFLRGDALQDLFCESDVLVLPSRRTRDWHEQFGRVLPEAMANGCAAIGSRTGAIPEVIGTDELTFEEDDVAGLASILKKLSENDVFLESTQKRLWCRVKDQYTNAVLAKRRVEFLRNVLG